MRRINFSTNYFDLNLDRLKLKELRSTKIIIETKLITKFSDEVYPDLKDVFGIEALDGAARRQAAKTRKKGRLDRGMSGDGGNGAGSQADPSVGAALKAVSGLRMRAKLRALARKK